VCIAQTKEKVHKGLHTETVRHNDKGLHPNRLLSVSLLEIICLARYLIRFILLSVFQSRFCQINNTHTYITWLFGDARLGARVHFFPPPLTDRLSDWHVELLH
jgi:hypothetical protein